MPKELADRSSRQLQTHNYDLVETRGEARLKARLRVRLRARLRARFTSNNNTSIGRIIEARPVERLSNIYRLKVGGVRCGVRSSISVICDTGPLVLSICPSSRSYHNTARITSCGANVIHDTDHVDEIKAATVWTTVWAGVSMLPVTWVFLDPVYRIEVTVIRLVLRAGVLISSMALLMSNEQKLPQCDPQCGLGCQCHS